MNAAALHLAAAIVGNEPEPALFEVRPERGRAEWFSVLNLERAVDCALRRSRQRETWVGMCPRRPWLKDGRQYGGSDAILHGWLVSVDCDSDDALEALERFRPRPSFVLTSGGLTESGRDKLHAHWALSRRIARSKITPAKTRLALALGSDMRVKDAARCMRLPGMVTHKYDEPRECVSVEDYPERRYTLPEVLARTPEIESVERKSHKRVIRETVEQARDNELPQKQEQISPRQYVEDLAGVTVGADGKALCPFHDERTPSLHAWAEPSRGFYCFGCGVGGDIYTFAARLRGIPQRELYGGTFVRIWESVRKFYGLPVDV